MATREKQLGKNIKKREKMKEQVQKKNGKPQQQQKQPLKPAKKRAAVVQHKKASVAALTDEAGETDDDFQATPAVVAAKRPPPSKKARQQQIQAVNSDSDSDDDEEAENDSDDNDEEEGESESEEDEHPAPSKRAKKAAAEEQPKGKKNTTKTKSTTNGTKGATSTAFASLAGLVSDVTLNAIGKMGFTEVTEILAKSLPPLLQGRDLVGAAQTGSDKTLAFLVPAVELIYKLRILPRNGTGVIIISPTCELAMQTFGVLTELMPKGEHTHGLVMDGSNRKVESEKLGKGINILVATPDRLLDHLQNSPDFLYKNLQCLVIDEVDRILEKGFEEELKQIINLLPKKRQTMLFSATQNEKIDALSKLALKEEPIYVSADDSKETASVLDLHQWYIECPSEKRLLVLISFLKKNRKGKVMVFFSSCMSVKYHHELFNSIDLPVTSIHGKQKQLKRTTTFLQFCNASEGILLCTDVAAGGLNIPNVDWIVQYDPPDDPKEYIHRIGHIGCKASVASSSGHALLLLRPEELGFIQYLKVAKVRTEKYPCKKIGDIQLELEKLISRNYFLSQSAKEAFKSYMRAYDSHQLNKIFDVNTLDWQAVAKSLGILVPQVVDLKFGAKRQRPEKRVGGGGFGYFKQMNTDTPKQRIFKQITRDQLHKNSKFTR